MYVIRNSKGHDELLDHNSPHVIEVPKINVHILHRIPIKSINKTHYILWTRKKHSLGYMHISFYDKL